MKPTFGSLYSGIGGLDKGLEDAGWKCDWQVEIDGHCQKLLASKWPYVHREHDIRDAAARARLFHVLAIIGGDPCQTRSRAVRGSPRSKYPDLAGYFLQVVGHLGPQWVVRENVCAPDVSDFVCGLELLGYRVIVTELDGASFTSCSRPREFCIGCLDDSMLRGFERSCVEAENASRHASAVRQTQESPLPCILASDAGKSYSSDAAYIFDERCGLRKLTPRERERSMGFPEDYTEGFSSTRRGIMLGEAVNMKCAEWLGRRILEAMA